MQVHSVWLHFGWLTRRWIESACSDGVGFERGAMGELTDRVDTHILEARSFLP
jgi:hypothetical protein